MSRYTPPSLLQHFAPPEDHEGSFGWLCGYSADASFLDAAAERFTQQTAGQRSYTGKVALVALLDRGQPQILPHEAPGVLHAPLRDATGFALLHAKVALLGFRHSRSPGRWCLRLIVSTGNWTRQTLERSLDLSWSVDLRSDDLDTRERSVLLARSDVSAAWDLVQWLQPRFDLGALSAASLGLTGIARELFVQWCGRAAGDRLPRPRFFDSRSRSLLSQLSFLVRHHAGDADRNTLVLGSGFYEAGEKEQVPSVLAKTVDALRERGVITARCDVHVVVEPVACQAVAAALPAMRKVGWRVWSAGQPDFLGSMRRRLHAKFVFASGFRKNSNTCLNAWLYLGSGNLTAPGFTQACPAGNLEAGVLVTEDALYWRKGRGLDPQWWTGNRLPLQWEHEILAHNDIASGEGMPERPAAFEPPPVAWCQYLPGGDEYPARLQLPEHDIPVDVLDTEMRVCTPCGPLEVAWPGPRQPSVVVRWQDAGRQLHCSIPVIDSAGRLAAQELPKLDLESAWWQLHQFPQPPAEEDTGADEREFDTGTAMASGALAIAETESVVRTMMRLVENIADKQVDIAQSDWESWCISLEQALRQAANCAAVKAFAEEIALNPLHALRQKFSLPAFAHPNTSPHRERYLAVLDAVSGCWGVADLPPIGSTQEDGIGLD